MSIIFEKGSYRDPAGKIFYHEGKIYRGLSKDGLKRYNYIKEKKILEESIKNKFLINTIEATNLSKNLKIDEFEFYLEHEKIGFISYPYEWCFDQLKNAALHHLNFQLFLLERNCVLIDASAYNIQFINTKPIFIDVLSLAEYSEGSYWVAHKQFCENFLNPLLLSAKKNINFNNWFRGNLEGISTTETNNVLNFFDKFNIGIFFHVYLMSRIEDQTIKNPNRAYKKLKNKKSISKKTYRNLLIQLKNLISDLKKKEGVSKWQNYSSNNTYKSNEEIEKIKTVKEFSNKYKFNFLADLGCNDGVYSFASLESGAKNVVGFDFDLNALNKAHKEAKKNKFNFQAVFMDAANPSPNQGWNSLERKSLQKRIDFDGMLALAFHHHLAIAKNIPFEDSLRWLVNFAPKGLIEFVPKKDETIKKMLQLRDDVFYYYNEENFINILSKFVKIISKKTISVSGRTLYEYNIL